MQKLFRFFTQVYCAPKIGLKIKENWTDLCIPWDSQNLRISTLFPDPDSSKSRASCCVWLAGPLRIGLGSHHFKHFIYFFATSLLCVPLSLLHLARECVNHKMKCQGLAGCVLQKVWRNICGLMRCVKNPATEILAITCKWTLFRGVYFFSGFSPSPVTDGAT